MAKQFHGDTPCPVCGTEPLVAQATDLIPEYRCTTCGMVYLVSAGHFVIPVRYLDLFPIIQLYWEENHTKLPFGIWVWGNPIKLQLWIEWYRWLASLPQSFEIEYPGLNWEKVRLKVKNIEWEEDHEEF